MKPALQIPWDARQRLSMLEEMLRRVVYEQGKGSSQVGSSKVGSRYEPKVNVNIDSPTAVCILPPASS